MSIPLTDCCFACPRAPRPDGAARIGDVVLQICDRGPDDVAIAVALPATVVTTLNSDHNGSVAMLGRTPSMLARLSMSAVAIVARQCSFCTRGWK